MPADRLTMSAVKRGADANYDTMTIEDLCALPVRDITDPKGCVIAHWVLGSMLEDGLRVMNAWGFAQRQTFVYIKTKKHPLESLDRAINQAIRNPTDTFNLKSVKRTILSVIENSPLGNVLGFGLGRLFRQTHEICLIGINNTGIYRSLADKSQRSVCFAPNDGHSIKPAALHESLEVMFPAANRLEMFARRTRPGWTCLGNEIDGRDIRDSLPLLANAR